MKQLAAVCTLLVVMFVFPPQVGERRPVEVTAIRVLRAAGEANRPWCRAE